MQIMPQQLVIGRDGQLQPKLGLVLQGLAVHQQHIPAQTGELLGQIDNV